MQIATQLSTDAKELADRLRTMSSGESVQYSTLSSLIHGDVQGKRRGALNSARRVLLREGIRFDVVRNFGLQRMTDQEVARSGSRSLRLIRSTARRETRKMAAISDFESLPNEDKIQHNTTLSVLGAVAHFAKPTQVKILEAAVATARQQLLVPDSMDALRRALKPK